MELWKNNKNLFDEYIRVSERILWFSFGKININTVCFFLSSYKVVISWSGFNKEVMEKVKEYNMAFGKDQPIILIESSQDLIGSLADEEIFKLDSRESRTSSKPIDPIRDLQVGEYCDSDNNNNEQSWPKTASSHSDEDVPMQIDEAIEDDAFEIREYYDDNDDGN